MLLSLLPPEAQLLFLAAGGPENDAAIRELLTSDLDWVEICRLADREKGAPMLWRRVRSIAPDRVPAGADAHLRKLARVVDFHMSYLEQLTLKSTVSLDRAGIDYTLLKGAALACSVYGSFGERSMVDLDILVEKSDARAAVRALISAGWLWRADKPIESDFSHLHHFPALIDPNGLVSLELHTTLFHREAPFEITTEAVLQSGRVTPFRTGTVRIPNPLYLLLHACIHLSWGHLFRQGALRTFRDINAIIAAGGIDWPRFIELADRHRARTCCFWTFLLAQKLIGAAIPGEALDELRPPLPRFLMQALERHLTLVLVPSGTTCPSASLRRVMWSSAILPRWSGHGAARPWNVLVLRPEDRAAREERREARWSADARRSGRQWISYGSSLFMSARGSRRKGRPLTV